MLLGLYLAAVGLTAAELGLVVGLGLAGNAAGTLLVAVAGDRLGRRAVLLWASILSAAGLAAMALFTAPAPGPLGAAAFVGMVNGMGRDRGPAQTLDQSLLAERVSDSERTAVFARYTFFQDVLGAFGSLAAGVPALLERGFAVAALPAYRSTLGAAAAVTLLQAVFYARLPHDARAHSADGSGATPKVQVTPASRRRVAALSGLFALDSLGGGFLAGSILSYWFFRRFGLTGEVLGPVFFAARALNALSYVGAEAIARRIGLVRTMVFTHLPSSLVLFALPWAPAPWIAIALFLLRESLVQMDVPTRQSYVAAVTAPGERTFALGVTGVTRNVGWTVGSALAGLVMGAYGLAAPLWCGAGLKVVYDVALYRSFKSVRAPEESVH